MKTIKYLSAVINSMILSRRFVNPYSAETLSIPKSKPLRVKIWAFPFKIIIARQISLNGGSGTFHQNSENLKILSREKQLYNTGWTNKRECLQNAASASF